MIPEECISECIKHKDRLYQIVQENMAQVQKKKKNVVTGSRRGCCHAAWGVLRQNKRSQQRKGGKLDPDFFGPYTVTKVDGKSIDIVDDHGKLFPTVNLDHLVHFFRRSSTKSSQGHLTHHNHILPCHNFFSPSYHLL